MNDERIVQALIKATKNGKLKWKFDGANHAAADFAGLRILHICGAFYVDGSCLDGTTGPAEIIDVMEQIYRSSEEFESAIMELECDDGGE